MRGESHDHGAEPAAAGDSDAGREFREAGYRTAIVGKWHLGDAAPCRPEDRGFEHVFVHGGGGIGQTPDYWGNRYHDPTVRTRGGWKETEGYCSDVFFDEALRWIGERAEKKEPFLMWLATNAAAGRHAAL